MMSEMGRSRERVGRIIRGRLDRGLLGLWSVFLRRCIAPICLLLPLKRQDSFSDKLKIV